MVFIDRFMIVALTTPEPIAPNECVGALVPHMLVLLLVLRVTPAPFAMVVGGRRRLALAGATPARFAMVVGGRGRLVVAAVIVAVAVVVATALLLVLRDTLDRKSTRLNSSHLGTSYAVFCL